jgi:hypothetical protein
MEAFLDDILFISKSLGLHHYLCHGCMLPNYFLSRYVNLFCFVMNVFFIFTYYNHMSVSLYFRHQVYFIAHVDYVMCTL